MNFIARAMVCERLKIKTWASYQLIKASRISLISTDDVIDLLNSKRKGREEQLTYIPSDFITSDELSKETGIPTNKIRAWVRRAKNVPPHFRLNKQTTRFRRSSINAWLAKQARSNRG